MGNHTTRTAAKPAGDGTLEFEVAGNEEFALALWIVFLCVASGVFVSLEHPLRSRAWTLPLVLFLLSLAGVYLIEFDACAYVKRPSEWRPGDGDVRVNGPSRLLTNNPYHESLRLKCGDVDKHKHAPTIGTGPDGVSRS